MLYQMRQKLFAFGDDFTIQDGHGDAQYVVDGRAFSIGDKLSFQDTAGNELAFIRQQLLSWGPKYDIHRDGKLVATVKKHHFTLLRCKFTVDVPGPDDLEAQGNFLEYHYRFERGGREIAQVSKKWFALRDTYGIEISEGADDVLILASAVVIDMICHDGQKHS